MIAIVLFVLLLPFTAHSAPNTPTERWSPATDCRANIRKATCRVNPQPDVQRGDPRVTRVCLGGEAPYAAELTKVYDELPPKLQKTFCHLRKIYIEEDMPVPSRVGSVPHLFIDKNNKERVAMNGYMLSLNRKQIFDFKGSLKEWLSRREQTVFGRPFNADLLPSLPQLEIKFEGSKANQILLYSIFHEFGHLYENSHAFNTFTCDKDAEGCKQIFKGLWNSISWMNDGTIRSEDRYFKDFIPCYENCTPEKRARIEDAVPMYASFLEKNSFVTPLAASSSSEDFAETFVFYMARKYFSDVEDPDGKHFSAYMLMPDDQIMLNKRTRHGSIANKMDFMAMFDSMTWIYETKNSHIWQLDEYVEVLTQIRGKPTP